MRKYQIKDKSERKQISGNGGFKKRQEKWRKKDFQHLTHTWMEEMVKKAIVYNTKKDEEKRGRKKQTKKEKERERT